MKESKNYLERRPEHPENMEWSADGKGIVTLAVENTGLFNRIAQKFFKKPKVSQIHLDELGSFVWPLIDGNKTIIEIGDLVKERFGDEAEPLYERLAKYFRILESYGFVKWNEQ